MVLALGQTVTVINRSGKVVSNSKHLVNIFKEAKSAYRERKAELSAAREAEFEEKRSRNALKDLKLDDERSNASSKRSSRHPQRSKSHRHANRPSSRPSVERAFTDSLCENEPPLPPRRPSRLRFSESPEDQSPRRGEVVRRHSDGPQDLDRRRVSRSPSDPDIDMDLAYGELPPAPSNMHENEAELRKKMSGLTRLLNEANCLQHSVTATIETLQKDPDALAAVALTLAEISNILARMGPRTMVTMSRAFPAVMALLASPQFMIAAGVGVGITVVAFGGYKIIKKIKQEKQEKEKMQMEAAFQNAGELKEMPEDINLDRIELWRRGIADVEAGSLGTTVDGEFITPGAEQRLIEEGVLREGDAKSTKSKRKKSTSKSPKTAKSEKSEKSERSSRPHKTSSKSGEKVKVKSKKEPSKLRTFFD